MSSASDRANRPVRAFSHQAKPHASGLAIQVVDASLAGCVFVVPFLMAGQHPLGQAVLVALSLTAALAWTVDQATGRNAPFRPTVLTLLWLAGMVVLMIQVIPLPQPLLHRISPKLAELLPLWYSEGPASARLGAWQTVSFTPAATRDGLLLLVAYPLLFLVTVQRVERMEDVERLLRWCAAAAGLTAVYALVQLVAGNGKYCWFYEHPYWDALHVAKANFTNRNQFAQFLALGVGPLLWWVHAAFGRTSTSPSAGSRPFTAAQPRLELGPCLLALGLALLFLAGFLSLSRAGTAAIILAASVSGAVCWRAASGNKGFVAILAVVGILVAVSLSIFGLERVSPRLGDLQSCSMNRLDDNGVRRSIWASDAQAVSDFPILGTGVGSHTEVYRVYHQDKVGDAELEFTHAVNGYLQIAMETGGAGLLVLLTAIVCCGWWCVGGLVRAPSARIAACLGAVTGSLAANAAHALVDFSWCMPACMVMVVVLSACAARLWHFANTPPGHWHAVRSGWAVPRFAYRLAVVVLWPLGVWMMWSQIQAVGAEPAWDNYCKSRMAIDRELLEGPKTPLDAARHAQKSEQRRIDLLEAVVQWRPDHARAHLELAECYLRLFDSIQADSENAMSLANLRDAVLRSRFPSREARDEWLGRAVGKHVGYLDRALRSVRRSLALCPVQGRAYVYLAELCFLENGGEDRKTACMEQALRVRPFDGEVLYSVAAEALLAGDYDRWLELARKSFQSGRPAQRRLIADLVSRTPQEVLEDMIQVVVREFQPDFEALCTLCAHVQRRGRPEQSVWLQRRCAEQAESDAKSAQGGDAARLWDQARQFYVAIGDLDRASECARSAAACDPGSFTARYGLGLMLLARGRPDEAEPHLRWCRQRRPNDAEVEAKWKEAFKSRLDQKHETATRKDNQRRT